MREAMFAGALGQICTSQGGSMPLAGVDWCADNCAFGDAYPGDAAYLAWLSARAWAADRCVFAVAPDVVGDARLTRERSMPMLEPIRALGFPVAYVAQNGATYATVPWSSFDVVFIGGDTAWKLGYDARGIVRTARARGVYAHMGRVNSGRRFRYAKSIGCDSVDGTFLAFGPDKNLPRLMAWLGK